MASFREMEAIRRDRARFVPIAKHCLHFPVNEWEEHFLNSLIDGSDEMGGQPLQLSIRQVEVLFDIRDRYEMHATLHGGFSVPIVIGRVYEARYDLEEDDEEWITALRISGANKLRRADIGRLRRCAVQIGEIDPY